jgi:hypothetical protein
MSFLLFFTAACLAEKQQIPIFTWPGLEPMIYRTRGEHANNCTTDAVNYKSGLQEHLKSLNINGNRNYVFKHKFIVLFFFTIESQLN